MSINDNNVYFASVCSSSGRRNVTCHSIVWLYYIVVCVCFRILTLLILLNSNRYSIGYVSDVSKVMKECYGIPVPLSKSSFV